MTCLIGIRSRRRESNNENSFNARSSKNHLIELRSSKIWFLYLRSWSQFFAPHQKKIKKKKREILFYFLKK